MPALKYCSGPISRTGPLSRTVTLRHSPILEMFGTPIDYGGQICQWLQDWVEREGRTQRKTQIDPV